MPSSSMRIASIAFGTLLLLLCISSDLVSGLKFPTKFPQGFVFGVSSSAFQYEGAVTEDGRGPSVWDPFSHTTNIVDGSNADISIDHYHRFPEDIGLAVDLGVDAYRLSISWSRILPDGTGAINHRGIEHYNKVLDALLSTGIVPYVTLNHYDHPQALEDAFGSMLSPHFVDAFAAFAEVCFQSFGDRVKHWITLNDPHSIANNGYNLGYAAPPLTCSPDTGNYCAAGDSSREPYIVGHHYLLAHAAAVDIYNKKYKAKQAGKIGITLNAVWYIPLSNSSADIAAAERARDFDLGWFMSPVIFGDYPESMKQSVGTTTLPAFTAEQSKMLRRTCDFVGINHYTTMYAADPRSNARLEFPLPDFNQPAYFRHTNVVFTDKKDGVPLGPQIGDNTVYPAGMRMLMNYIRTRYDRPAIVITENGLSDPHQVVLDDHLRVAYLSGHLHNLAQAIRDGCDVRGYFVWSLLDNWEWNYGRAVRYGLYHVDYDRNLTRTPKLSAYWYKKYIANVKAASDASQTFIL